MTTALGSVFDLDTPALVIDLDVLEGNLQRMADLTAHHGVGLRPHAKTHKTWELARLQREYGAIGHTVARVGEAEVLAEGGAQDLLIALPVLGTEKLARLWGLAGSGVRLTVAVDSGEAIRQLAASAPVTPERRVGVVIEIDSGFGRCGVQSVEEALALADEVARHRTLAVAGVMGFGGQAYRESTQEGRDRIGVQEGRQAVEFAQALSERGFDISMVSVGCTPSTPGAVTVEGVTEVRAGVYVFNDRKQIELGAGTENAALSVLATVVSTPKPGRFVLDTGLKAMAGEDYGWGTYGLLHTDPPVEIAWAAEEHGIVHAPDGPDVSVGDRIRVLPNHACGAVNMHDEAYVVRGGEVVDVWRIRARGPAR